MGWVTVSRIIGGWIIIIWAISGSWDTTEGGQVDDLTGEDQTGVPNLWVNSQNVGEGNPIPNCNVTEGISPLYNISGGAHLHGVGSRRRCVVSHGDVQHLARVEPHSKSLVSGLNGFDRGAAGCCNTAPRITRLDGHIAGAAGPGQCPSG